MEEAKAINSSLTQLGIVIKALSEGTVPSYRNNPLTYLMQDSLGGTAKTLMFVNCSPSINNEAETKNSLDYAERVRKVKNKADKHVVSKESAKILMKNKMLEEQMDKMEELLLESEKADEWKEMEKQFEKDAGNHL